MCSSHHSGSSWQICVCHFDSLFAAVFGFPASSVDSQFCLADCVPEPDHEIPRLIFLLSQDQIQFSSSASGFSWLLSSQLTLLSVHSFSLGPLSGVDGVGRAGCHTWM